jgi:hypothetical protein
MVTPVLAASQFMEDLTEIAKALFLLGLMSGFIPIVLVITIIMLFVSGTKASVKVVQKFHEDAVAPHKTNQERQEEFWDNLEA